MKTGLANIRRTVVDFTAILPQRLQVNIRDWMISVLKDDGGLEKSVCRLDIELRLRVSWKAKPKSPNIRSLGTWPGSVVKVATLIWL